MNDLRQSPQYARYLRLLGWQVEEIDNCYIFIRKIPFLPFSIIKVQRPPKIPFEKIEKLAEKHRAIKITIEPTDNTLIYYHQTLTRLGYKLSASPFLPTKTLRIDLTQSENKIFKQMKKKTRYALRKAQKNNLRIEEAKDIASLIHLKSPRLSPFYFFTKKEIESLWQAFYPANASLLLSYFNTSKKPLAGVLLLFYQKTAYYFLAGATKEGKRLGAPTLLVWEAIKLAKKRGCQVFDFEGIYDERFPITSWKGFTHFKKGFGGKEIEYPGCFVKNRLPFSSPCFA